jgi:hypothetical protein
MSYKYRCAKGTSRLSLGVRELEQVVDQLVRMNALADLSTEEVDQIRWLAVGLFHSPNGLPTAAWIRVNQSASRRNLGIYLSVNDREGGLTDPGLQRAAANWLLIQRRLPGVQEQVDPLEPFPELPEPFAA